MPERASAFQGVQIAKESTAGTGVAANKVLKYLDFAIASPGLNFAEFRPMGQAVPSAIVPVYEETQLAIGGVGSYSEMTYLFDSLLHTTTPTTSDTTAKTWTWTPAARTENTQSTYTIEQGGSVRAEKATYCHATGAEVTFNRTDGVSIGGSGRGQLFQDNITLTASPTGLLEVPIVANQIDVYIDSTAAGLGATKYLRDFDVTYRMNDVSNTVKPLDSTKPSFAATVGTPPTAQMELVLERDSQGMGLLTAARAGSTQFVRVKCTSTVLAGAATAFHALTIDFAGKVSDDPSRDDRDGVDVATWTLSGVYDTTWAKYQQVVLVNQVASL